MMRALRKFLGENDIMAYLTMMANRLLELRRVLKPTGSLYLHCDPTASHYLKIVLDGVFGKERFLNEISWKRSSADSDTKQGMRRCGKIRDVIFFTPRETITVGIRYIRLTPKIILNRSTDTKTRRADFLKKLT